jgi:hypothetical protein
MPEPLMIPDSSAPIESTKPIPSIQPAGVTVEGVTPQATAAPAPMADPQKNHFEFLKNIDWVEAIVVIAAITGIVYAVNYYSTQIKTQNGVITTLTNDIANLQTTVQGLQKEQQASNVSASSVNSSGGINKLF